MAGAVEEDRGGSLEVSEARGTTRRREAGDSDHWNPAIRARHELAFDFEWLSSGPSLTASSHFLSSPVTSREVTRSDRK